ncbi:hypothetical protein GGR52DRAFT_417172 [Hypoxylon sp. FL1284]|nr:hypothetical protein GGR52DRAFT_417172 [Hypoxylon sp. FL1284]
MPALTSALLLDNIAGQNESSLAATALASNTTADNVMQVVCAWPVSGQYGPGSRILYYALVAACVVARKVEWLRNASLAAALIFPAVAALHSIVLAIIHNNSAVDMDIYGAFQFCSIGILAAPLTVRLSRTYFYDPGRNIIFLWSGVVLAGLLSLTVEFFRINTLDCHYGPPSFPAKPGDKDFEHLADVCGIPCSIDDGPHSPLRQGSANEIAIIPAPSRLTFDAAILIAAACCIPALLSLVSMWNKILEINWKARFGQEDKDEPIEGTNGATVKGMGRVNSRIKLFLSTLEIPLFGTAVLAILIVGELNLFSPEVIYQTEPMTSIGQWAPVVGTGLAALGSLYLLLSADLDAEEEEDNPKHSTHHCNCSHHHLDGGSVSFHEQPGMTRRPDSLGIRSIHSYIVESPERHQSDSPTVQETGLFTGPSPIVTSPERVYRCPSTSDSGRDISPERTSTAGRDVGHRRKVAKVLTKISNYLGTASEHQFDDSEFRHGKAMDFPEIPGEEMRNPALMQIRQVYNQPRDEDENAGSSPGKRPSRSGSFARSVRSTTSAEGSARMSRAPSIHQPPSPVSRGTFDLGEPSSSDARGRPTQRRATLEVPEQTYQGSLHYARSPSPAATIDTTVSNVPGSPAIVISPDPNTGPGTQEIPSLNVITAPSPLEPESPTKAAELPP